MEMAEREGLSLSGLIRKRMAVEPLDPDRLAERLVGPLTEALLGVLSDLDTRIAREVVIGLRRE